VSFNATANSTINSPHVAFIMVNTESEPNQNEIYMEIREVVPRIHSVAVGALPV